MPYFISLFFYNLYMKILIQKVKYSKLIIKEKIIGEIRNGYLIYLGIEKKDKNREEEIINKFLKFKFIDEAGKFKNSLIEKYYPLMIIPNITLVSSVSNNKPEFKNSPLKDEAKNIYENFLKLLKSKKLFLVEGIFGEEMIIENQNDGPINFVLDL